MKSKVQNSGAPTKAGFRLCLWTIVIVSIVSVGCTRTITTRKRTYSIKGSEQDDSGKMRERYASGFSVGESGNMQTDKKDLYTEQMFRKAKGKDVDLKDYRMGKKDFDMKEYRTPEYLTRQKDHQIKTSKFYKDARESDVDRFTTYTGAEEAKIRDKPGFLDWLNPFSKKKAYRDSGKIYRTSTNRAGSRAMENPPSPVPMSRIGAGPQDQVNPSLSMDEVKKMLNPESFD